MSYADLSPVSREPMRPPAAARVIIGSLLAGLLLNLLPWNGAGLLLRPDFLLVVLLFWTAHEPRMIGQGMGFFLALLMDVADSALLGQHALAYVAAIFLVQVLRLRILQLSFGEQALHIVAILFASQTVTLLLNSMLGRDFPGLWMFAAPLLGGLLWPLVGLITSSPRLRRSPSTTVMR